MCDVAFAFGLAPGSSPGLRFRTLLLLRWFVPAVPNLKEYPQILFFGNIGHPGSVTVVCYLFQTKQLTRKDKLAREVQLDCVQNTLEPPEATNR